MTYGRRLTLLTGSAVAVSILLASLLGYLTMRSELLAQIDGALRHRVAALDGLPLRPEFPGRRFGPRLEATRPGPEETAAYFQLVSASGSARALGDRLALPVTAGAREVAAHARKDYIYETTVRGDHVRVLVAPLAAGGAAQIGRSLSEVDAVLRRLGLILTVVAVGGVLLAVFLGRLVARRAIEPLRRLDDAATHVARTQDLARRIDASGHDEISSLAASFNAMLDVLQRSVGELDSSVRAQRQLVADASHELRTPVTSLRTNIEILRGEHRLTREQRDHLLDVVLAQIEELTVLMNDLIDLARGEHRADGHESVRFDEVVGESLERAERHSPQTRFEVDLDSTRVSGSADRLSRAVNNLLDNAAKWNTDGEPVEVSLRDGVLRVRDHGPGVPADELPHVFDRFFRGAHSRQRSGSGLGLAIVRQVAETHGGTVGAAPAPGGGTVFELRVPAIPEKPSRESAGLVVGPS